MHVSPYAPCIAYLFVTRKLVLLVQKRQQLSVSTTGARDGRLFVLTERTLGQSLVLMVRLVLHLMLEDCRAEGTIKQLSYTSILKVCDLVIMNSSFSCLVSQF